MARSCACARRCGCRGSRGRDHAAPGRASPDPTPRPIRAISILLAAALAVGCGPPPERPAPAGRLRAMREAAEGGDLDAYLDCFGGDLRARLAELRRTMGDEAFLADLRRTYDGVKGISTLKREAEDPDVAAFDVAYVRVDGEETTRVRLRWDGRAWRITEMSRAERRKPPIPYGTPVWMVDPRTGELIPGASPPGMEDAAGRSERKEEP